MSEWTKGEIVLLVQQDIATFSNLRYPHGYEATCNSHHDGVFMRQHSLCGTL